VVYSDVVRYSGDFTPGAEFENDEHTVVYWSMDVFDGEVVEDESGNNNDLILHGASHYAVH